MKQWISPRRRRLAFTGNRSTAAQLFVALAVVGASGALGDATSGASTGARTAQAPACTSTAVTPRVSTNQWSYAPGAVVSMKLFIRNTSDRSCTLAVGPSTPSFTITNAKGQTVWSACDVADRPGACALYLAQRTLAPGATFTRTVVWDQRTGPTRSPAPMGVYWLTTRFVVASVLRFTLSALNRPRTVTVTAADRGQIVTLHVGQRLGVRLVSPSIYEWTEPASSNESVLMRTSGTAGATATGDFVAVAKGVVRVTAIDNPTCYPQCLAPSRLFSITVSVVG